MAFAFGFPQDVTDLVYSMRDWRLEMVRDGGKAPSARCFNIDIPRSNDDKYPSFLVFGMPSYEVHDADSSDEEYDGQILCDPDHFFITTAWIECYNPSRRFVLREYQGRVPAKFRRLQKQNDRRIQEMWFQCEPCASDH